MANNLATLNSKLATALRDTTHAVWGTTEKDDLVTWAVAGLYPRIARPVDPSSNTITLVTDTYFYSVPSGTIEVENIEWINDGNERGYLQGQTWAEVGDRYGTLKVRVSPTIVTNGGTLRVHGYGRYDVTTNLIPDDFVPLVIAKGRAEAYRRVAGERARFEQWMVKNQKQGVSVNELLQQINEADNDARRLEATFATPRRPRPGRLG